MDVDKVWIMCGLCMDNPWIMYGCDIHILSILYPRLTFYGSTEFWAQLEFNCRLLCLNSAKYI